MPKAVAQPQSEPAQWAPNLFGKQWDIFNTRKRIVLVSGSRYSGKTLGVGKALVRWAIETPGARTGIFAKSLSLAKSGGVWQDLLDVILPEFFEAGMTEFTSRDKNKALGPAQDGQTRVPYFRIRNAYGGESEFMLFSINNDDEVASKVKSKRFSTIYFPELSMFKDKRILSVTLPQLRMEHLQPRNGEPDLYHHWIADTNPDEELGTESWIYKVWYEEKHQKNHPHPEFQKQLEVFEMPVEDNPYITAYQIEELEALCAGDDMLMDAYRRGIWPTRGGSRFHFRDVYNRSVHVIGSAEEGEGDQIQVNSTTTTLFGGWDTGKVNHAVVLLDKAVFMVGDKEKTYWSVLDEFACLDEEIELSAVVDSVMDKMAEIEKRHGHRFGWIHWSDDSAMTLWNPTSGSYDSTEITACSGGTIHLQPVVKARNSVKTRVRLIRRLLKENRLFVSYRCERVQQMLANIKHGTRPGEVMFQRDRYKHIFDALSYPILMESLSEMEEGLINADTAPQIAKFISV